MSEYTDTHVGLAGDWHGNVQWAKYAIQKFHEAGIREIWQVGDFGYWGGSKGHYYLSDISDLLVSLDITLLVVPGNHENWALLKEYWDENPDVPYMVRPNLTLLPRGYSFFKNNRLIYTFAGAPSIDFQYRTEGMDWWLDELPTVEERERLLVGAESIVERYERADVFLAHDIPNIDLYDLPGPLASILSSNPMGWPNIALKYAEYGRQILTPFYETMKPRLWVNGHYHSYGVRHDDEGNLCWLSLHMDGQYHNCKILKLEDLTIEHLDL